MKSGESQGGSELEMQLAALTSHAGIARREDRIIVRMSGDDRASFLHGMCTNDIKKLQPGMLTYALALTDHAHVIADFYAMAGDDAIYLDVDRGLWPRMRAHLEKFLVADDVEMEEQEQLAVIEVTGPASAAAVASIAPEAAGLAPWRFVKHDQGFIANLPRIGLAAFTVVLPTPQADDLEGKMLAADPENRQVSVAALDVLRVEQGLARVGVDATDKTIALEARLQNGISYDKGCYVGQETIERATARGGVKKRLLGLRITGRHPRAGATAWMDGKEVGQVTSVAESPRLGVVGLGIMHHSAWQPGTSVILKDPEGDIPAVVSELPF